MNITINDLDVGVIGQVQGPFSAGSVIQFNESVKLKVGIFIEEKDLMSFDNIYYVQVNNGGNIVDVYITKAGVYELDEDVAINSITFPLYAPASVKVDYVVLADT